MKSYFFIAAWLVSISMCVAYTDAELDKWYGNDNRRLPGDDLMEEVSSKPASMSMQEYRAIQATNQTPVLAEVIASNIAHAVQMGQDTNDVTWTKADELRMSILPPPEPTEDWMHQRSRHLMMLMGIPQGDISVACTNWFMPTNIGVNGVLCGANLDDQGRFEIHTVANVQQRVASGRLYKYSNGKEARIEGFLTYLRDVRKDQVGAAFGLSVNNVDPATNMIFLCANKEVSPQSDVLIYKNIVLHMHAETNALMFASEIINAGLPEEERIPLSPTQWTMVN